jgi:hypothetical protein
MHLTNGQQLEVRAIGAMCIAHMCVSILGHISTQPPNSLPYEAHNDSFLQQPTSCHYK